MPLQTRDDAVTVGSPAPALAGSPGIPAPARAAPRHPGPPGDCQESLTPGAFWVAAATSDKALIVTLVPASFMG
jgi:hypothetical protein